MWVFNSVCVAFTDLCKDVFSLITAYVKDKVAAVIESRSHKVFS